MKDLMEADQNERFDIMHVDAQMGTADAILDLVSSGTTLRENNLKEIEGGAVLSSQVPPWAIICNSLQKPCIMILLIWRCKINSYPWVQGLQSLI